MPDNLLLRGLLFGFFIAMPVGPIGVLCIQRTLHHGLRYGFMSGLGAATADAVYGLVAAFGLTFISSFLTSQVTILRLVGGLFLCYLGVKTVLSQATQANEENTTPSFLQAYSTTFFLTLTNPMTILSFTLIFAGLGLSGGSDYGGSSLLVLGVFLGSAAWWLILSGGVSLLRQKIYGSGLVWVNRGAGLIILGFGLLSLWSIYEINQPF